MKLVNFSAVVTLLALTSLPARSQKPAAPLPATTAAPWTRGSCSPAVTGQNDQFTIHCPGMANEQGEKLLGIVNKILANELDPQLVLAKLDEIQRGLKPNLPVKTYFCDGMWQSIGPKADTVLDSKTGGNDFDFLNMISLFKSNQYPKLLKTCLASIDSEPSWLTSRLFCGLAYAHLNDKVKAQAMLREFESKAGPSYDALPCHDMSVILRALLK
jgi:hypothetical protein